jgi:antitoxin component YwqK of YwqJK toxin-antitoxin module
MEIEIEYQNKYFKQFFDIFLEIAKWSSELWWKICITFRKIGICNLYNKQLRAMLKNKFSLQRGIVYEDSNNFNKLEYYRLPNGDKHGMCKIVGLLDKMIHVVCFYKDGRLHGAYKSYRCTDVKSFSPDKNIYILKHFKNGLAHGKYEQYDEKGNVIERYFYIYGLMHGKKYTNHHNNVIESFYNLGDNVASILQIKPIKYPPIITNICKRVYIFSLKKSNLDSKEIMYYSVDYEYLISKSFNFCDKLDFYTTPTGLNICGLKSSFKLKKLITQYENYRNTINTDGNNNLSE